MSKEADRAMKKFGAAIQSHEYQPTDEEAMQKLRDGVARGKEALKDGRLPTHEREREPEKQKGRRGRPRGARNKSKLGDRRPTQ